MSSYLGPLLSSLPRDATAPASPSSTSVSDGSECYDETGYEGGLSEAVGQWRGQGTWKGKGRDAADAPEVVGVGGDKLPYEIWMQILKQLGAAVDLKACQLVSHTWCGIVVELLWYKPSLHHHNTFYRLLNVIDPIPVQDETIGAHRARMLADPTSSRPGSPAAFDRSAFLPSSSSSSSAGSNDGDASPAGSRLPPRTPAGPSGSGTKFRHPAHLPWDNPSFCIDDPAELASTGRSPERTFEYAQYVRRLNFGSIGNDISDHSFYRLRHCSRLERFTLQGCSKLSDAVLEAVLGGGNMPHLVAIDLTNVRNVTDRTIISIAKGCPNLQGLNLSGCKLLTDEGIVAIAEHCPLLRRLKLVKCNLMTDVSLVAIARRCPLLLEVDLVDVAQITSIGIRELWLYAAHLRELRLSACTLIADEGFPFLVPQPSNSRYGPHHPPQTMFIEPSEGGEGSASSAVIAPTESWNTPIPLPPPNWDRPFEHLRILDLTSCALLTDRAVEAIISNAPRIRALVLAKCPNLTDESIYSICRLGRSLHQFHMGHASKITDGAVSQLARSCIRLRYVDLACCPLLTDMSVLELSQLSKLRRIGLVKVTNLTDNAIHALVERPHCLLERIHFSYCERISIEAVHYLLQRLPKLTHLSLTGVTAFRRPDLQKFCRTPPKDFNPHQRAAFCVYSGSGVDDLRRHLAAIHDPSSTRDRSPPSPSSSVSGTFDNDQEDDDDDDDRRPTFPRQSAEPLQPPHRVGQTSIPSGPPTHPPILTARHPRTVPEDWTAQLQAAQAAHESLVSIGGRGPSSRRASSTRTDLPTLSHSTSSPAIFSPSSPSSSTGTARAEQQPRPPSSHPASAFSYPSGGPSSSTPSSPASRTSVLGLRTSGVSSSRPTLDPPSDRREGEGPDGSRLGAGSLSRGSSRFSWLQRNSDRDRDRGGR